MGDLQSSMTLNSRRKPPRRSLCLGMQNERASPCVLQPPLSASVISLVMRGFGLYFRFTLLSPCEQILLEDNFFYIYINNGGGKLVQVVYIRL